MDTHSRSELERINTVIRTINRVLVAAETRASLDEDICRALTEGEAYPCAWLGEYDAESGLVRPTAVSGVEPAAVDPFPLDPAPPVLEAEPTKSAIVSGNAHVARAYVEAPDPDPSWVAPLSDSIESVAVVPLATETDRYGVLTIYSERQRAFDAFERTFLEELGETIAVSIEGLDARAALEVRTAQYEQLVERISEGYYAVDTDWVITYWNEKMEERTGAAADSVVGRVVWEAFPVLVGTRADVEYRNALASQESSSFEMFVPDPYNYWVEADVYPDEDGLSIFSRDVSDRKANEAELTTAKRRLDAIIEHTSEAIYIKDAAGTYQFINDVGAAVFDREPAAVVGQNDVDLFEPESVASIREDDQAVMDARVGTTLERVRHVDGREYIFIDNKFPFRDETGEVIGIMGVSRDITERKQQEREWEETSNTLEAIITASPDAIGMIDEDLRVTLWNPAAEATFGWSEAEVLGEPIPIVPADRRQEFDSLLARLDEGESNHSIETTRQTKSGDPVAVSVSSAKVAVGEDEFEYLAIFKDDTLRKAYERRLERQRDNLELLNEMVRHDIRNHLQLVSAWSEMLEAEDLVAADGQEFLATIREHTGHAVDLTMTARDLSEVLLENEFAETSVNVARVLEDEVEKAQVADRRGVLTLQGRIPSVRVRANEMLDSVFRNLIENAFQHNDKRVPEVAVTIEDHPETVTIRVADNGPGIPADRKLDVFGKGEKGLESGGTGIGLYLVTTLVDSYEGEVWVEDNEPSGAVFVVELQKAEFPNGNRNSAAAP